MRTNLPRAVRALRLRRGWRQADLAARAGCTRQAVSRLECGGAGTIKLATLDAIARALGASLDLTLRWEGALLDRTLDAAHARIVEIVVTQLNALGWETRLEVSFNHYGDRGRVDILAYHRATGALLIVEVKTAIGNIQDALGTIDIKVRLGRVLARSVGWPDPLRTLPALVIADTRGARALVSRHPAAFARFGLHGRRALAWLRHPAPSAPTGVLWFVKLPDVAVPSTMRARRVRVAQTRG